MREKNPRPLKSNIQIVERGKIGTLTQQYMTAHFAGLTHAPQQKVRAKQFNGSKPWAVYEVRAVYGTNSSINWAYFNPNYMLVKLNYSCPGKMSKCTFYFRFHSSQFSSSHVCESSNDSIIILVI